MELLRAINKYCETKGMAPSSFGRQAAGDARLVADLRRGRRVGPKLAARIHAFIARGVA